MDFFKVAVWLTPMCLHRHRERERERRLDEKDRHGVKKSKLTRDSDRDVSEKIALGQAYTGAGTGMGFCQLHTCCQNACYRGRAKPLSGLWFMHSCKPCVL